MDQPSISIGDFALGLIEEEKSKAGSNAFSSSQQGEKDQIDISQVELSNSDRDRVLAESFGLQASAPSKPKRKPTPLKEEKRRLKEEYTSTLQKLKDLIEEMTTVGMIGVNMAGPQKTKKKKKKKRGTNKSY